MFWMGTRGGGRGQRPPRCKVRGTRWSWRPTHLPPPIPGPVTRAPPFLSPTSSTALPWRDDLADVIPQGQGGAFSPLRAPRLYKPQILYSLALPDQLCQKAPRQWAQTQGTRALTLDVQITSRRLMFIQLSQLTRCPLYVSPFLSSTSWKETAPSQPWAPREAQPYF